MNRFDPQRRDFIVRGAKAAIGLAVAGGLPLAGRSRSRAARHLPPSWSYPDYSVAPPHRMVIAQGEDRTTTLRSAIQALGGWKTFVQPGEVVLIKVNAAFASPPILCATTHPHLLAEVVRGCFEAGARSVIITDNPVHAPMSVFERTGMLSVARDTGARLWIPGDNDFAPLKLAKARLLNAWPVLRTPFEGVHRVIGLAPVKDHNRSGASLALKNWMGLLGGSRGLLHQDIHEAIAELAVMIRPTLVILDGTFVMMRNGPTGGSLNDLYRANTIVAGTDPVAVDAFGLTLLNRSVSEAPYVALAAAKGAGTASYELLQPIRVKVDMK